jgi:hypothetical protein
MLKKILIALLLVVATANFTIDANAAGCKKCKESAEKSAKNEKAKSCDKCKCKSNNCNCDKCDKCIGNKKLPNKIVNPVKGKTTEEFLKVRD